MRLIDADALLKAFYRELDNAILYGRIVKSLQELIKEAPTIDAVPVVRCKDCRYCSVDRHADGNAPDYACIKMDCGVEADDYCSYGERRDDETD